MTVEKHIEIANALLETGLLNSVYHSVELYTKPKGKFPMYKKGADQYYVGPDDRKGRIAYIRTVGAIQKSDDILNGSCSKSYKLRPRLRIVVFNAHEAEDFETLIKKILQFTFMKDVSLISYKMDAEQLSKEESSIGDYKFDATTFYLAIDVYVNMIISPMTTDCNTQCVTYPNPLCNELLLHQNI